MDPDPGNGAPAQGPPRVSIVVARFNGLVTSRLLAGAKAALATRGARPRHVVHCSGAWELPIVANSLAREEGTDAVVALGCVVRGATPHFDYVAGEAARGLAEVALRAGIPVVFGVLTTDTIEQALARASGRAGNKGWEAALTALDTVAAVRTGGARSG